MAHHITHPYDHDIEFLVVPEGRVKRAWRILRINTDTMTVSELITGYADDDPDALRLIVITCIDAGVL